MKELSGELGMRLSVILKVFQSSRSCSLLNWQKQPAQ